MKKHRAGPRRPSRVRGMLLALGVSLPAGVAVAQEPPTSPPPPPTDAATVSPQATQTPPPPATAPVAAPPAAPAPAAAEAKPPVVKAGDEGFSLKSGDGQFELKIRGYAQADGRFFLSDQERRLPSTFLMRRVRPVLEGTLFGRFDFRLMTDFGGGTATIQDAYIDGRIYEKSVVLRAGKFKPPIGLERLQSATAITFIERSLPTNLVPNRDVGIQLQGQLWDGVLSYSAGFFNGQPDLGAGDVDTEDNKDLVARLWTQPLKKAPFKPLQKLGLGIAGSRGEQGGLPTATGLAGIRSTGQQTVFSYRAPAAAPTAADTVVAKGTRTRLAPQFTWSFGPAGLWGEYVVTTHRVGIGADEDRLRFIAWNLSGNWVFGGDASWEGVKPKTSVSGTSGGPGAFELAARYSDLRIPAAAFPVFADPARSVQRIRAVGVAGNWYLNRTIRIGLNLERNGFVGGAAGGGDRPVELALFNRFQVSF